MHIYEMVNHNNSSKQEDQITNIRLPAVTTRGGTSTSFLRGCVATGLEN